MACISLSYCQQCFQAQQPGLQGNPTVLKRDGELQSICTHYIAAGSNAAEGMPCSVSSLVNCMQGEIEEVQALVNELMSTDHPLRAHVDMCVETMNSNSSYTLDKKVYQVKHLIHSLTSPIPKRLATRGLLGMDI